MTSNVLLIGNTGVGKSYLLNSLGAEFNTGFNAVHGLTAECKYWDVTVGNSIVRLIDAPGLLEATDENIARNCRAITEALRTNGQFKLIFVLAECAGRVNPSDLFTIGKVMSAVDFSIDVGVIVNKVPDEEINLYDGETKANIIKQLNSVANDKIRGPWFAVIPRFRQDNPTGPRSHMVALLREMTPQTIDSVSRINATIKEYNSFLKFLMRIRDFFVGLWQRFLEWL